MPRPSENEPRWYVVDVKLVRKLKRLITLDELRKHARKELCRTSFCCGEGIVCR